MAVRRAEEVPDDLVAEEVPDDGLVPVRVAADTYCGINGVVTILPKGISRQSPQIAALLADTGQGLPIE